MAVIEETNCFIPLFIVMVDETNVTPVEETTAEATETTPEVAPSPE